MRELVGSPPEVLDFREIRYTKQDGVATVTIDRPHVYNAYSTRTLQDRTPLGTMPSPSSS
jgi:1,4-dihydroxy-2-naphthoyl-CoA synthase